MRYNEKYLKGLTMENIDKEEGNSTRLEHYNLVIKKRDIFYYFYDKILKSTYKERPY